MDVNDEVDVDDYTVLERQIGSEALQNRLKRSRSQAQVRQQSASSSLKGSRGDDYIFPPIVWDLATKTFKKQIATNQRRQRPVSIKETSRNTARFAPTTVKPGFQFYQQWKLKLLIGQMPSTVSTSTISLKIYLNNGSSPLKTIVPVRGMFIAGVVEESLMELPMELGNEIYYVRLRLNPSGIHADLLVDAVEIEQVGATSNVYRLNCRRWLTGDDPYVVLSVEQDFQLEMWKPVETIKYRVIVKTSDIWNAGTDGRVWLTLNGEFGTSEQLELDNLAAKSPKSLFEKGMFDTFYVDLHNQAKLGELSWLRFTHQAKQKGLGWHLEHVVVVSDDDRYLFLAGSWIKKTSTSSKTIPSIDLRSISVPKILQMQDEDLWKYERWRLSFDVSHSLLFYSASSKKPLRITSGGFIDAKGQRSDQMDRCAVFKVMAPAMSQQDPRLHDSVIVGLMTDNLEQSFCLSFTDKSVVSEDPVSFTLSGNIRVRCLFETGHFMLESLQFPGNFIATTSHGQIYRCENISFPFPTDLKFQCYVKGCFRHLAIIQLRTSQRQTLAIYRDGPSLWAQGKPYR